MSGKHMLPVHWCPTSALTSIQTEMREACMAARLGRRWDMLNWTLKARSHCTPKSKRIEAGLGYHTSAKMIINALEKNPTSYGVESLLDWLIEVIR